MLSFIISHGTTTLRVSVDKPRSRAPSLTSWIQCFGEYMHLLVPSPLGGDWQTARRAARPTTRAKTEWVDGLRGLAAIAVCLSHLLGGTHPDLDFAYGDGPARSQSWLKLPAIRLLYGGDAVVAIFFLISGSVLSRRPIRPMRRGQRARPCFELASSLLRRTGRLLLPALASSFLFMIAAQIGLCHSQPAGPDTLFFIPASRRASLVRQFGSWVHETTTLLRPGQPDLAPTDLIYGVQLWTISMELYASFVLYLYLLTLAAVDTMHEISGIETIWAEVAIWLQVKRIA